MPNKRTQTKKNARKGRVRKAILKMNPRVYGKGRLYIPWPLPSRMDTSLRYCDIMKLSSASGAIATDQYNITSLYDPDYTGIGHQPYGFDQISGLFNAYCVISWYGDFTFTCGTANVPMRVILEPKFNNATTVSNMSLSSERPFSKVLIVSPGQTVKYRVTYNLPQIAGMTLSNWLQTCGAVPGASPTVSTYLNVSATSADYSTTGVICWSVDMKYRVRFTQAAVQTQS